MTHDVFVSYSSADNEIVRQRLEVLRERQVSFWFAPDPGNVLAGEDFASSVETAIGQSKVLLLMVSAHSAESAHVQREFVRAEDRGLPIIPLLVVPEGELPKIGSFKYRLANKQFIRADATATSWIEELVVTLRHHGVAVADPKAATGGKRTRLVSGLMPYLANRDAQEEIIQATLEQHLQTRPHRPIAFIVHGERSHCCDMFAERLARHSLPGYLQRITGNDQLEWKSIRWPEQSEYARTIALRVTSYCRTLMTRLELPLTTTQSALMLHLGSLRRAVLFSSILGGEGWLLDEAELIRDVIRWWSQAPDVPSPCQPLILLLSVSYASSEPSMFERLFKARPQSQTAQELCRLTQVEDPAICVSVLPELTSLSLSDVETWVWEVMQPSEADEVLRVIRAVYAGRRKDAEQMLAQMVGARPNLTLLLEAIAKQRLRSGRVPMEPLAPLLKQLLRAESVMRSL